MKCKNCGGNLSIQDVKCPYCQTPNPHYQRHRADMFRFRRDYEKTKDEVMEKSSRFVGMTVKITLIAILAFLNILFLLLAFNSWSIISYFEERQVEREADQHRAALEEYEKNCDYIGLQNYYDIHNLYSSEKLDDFSKVYQACSSFSYIYENLVILGQDIDYREDMELIESISDSLDYLYDSFEPEEYEPASYYEGDHGKLLEQMEYDLQVLLRAYTHITAEEAQNFPQMSDGRRQVAMERGLGLDD